MRVGEIEEALSSQLGDSGLIFFGKEFARETLNHAEHEGEAFETREAFGDAQGLCERQRVVGPALREFADAAGAKVGDVLQISEVSVSPMPVYYAMASDAGGAKASTPVQAGTQDLSVNVTVVYAIA